MSTWWQILSRRKHVPAPVSQTDLTSSSTNESNSQNETPRLARVLTTLDLTALGVGSTLGVGVYVLAGHVAKETAGPSVVLSFLIAAVASVFAGLCYAEFGARVPKAGSAYIYSYATVGEFIAFIIGWNLILEYVIGSASVAKGLSVYLDSLLNNTMKNAFIEIAPINTTFMSEYFDFFSFGITILLGGALAFGVKESSIINNIFTLINILVVVFVVIAGSIEADPKNWKINKDDIPPGINGGEGGFFPFGIAGTIKGAATCFYGFVGFDCIATTGEEVNNPRRAIPISIIVSLFIIFLSYFGTSAVVTLMLPYYAQDPNAPIPHAFDVVGWNWAKWIVSIGGIFGLCASLFGAMFPLPRIIYAMANDALVFRCLGTINSRFRTPMVGTILASVLTGLMSALFNLKQLVNMMSIGTLIAYTIVAACVIILRYSIKEEENLEYTYSLLQPGMDIEDEYSDEGHIYENQDAEYTENLNLIPPSQEITIGKVSKQMFNFSRRNPTNFSQKLVTILVFFFSILCLILASLVSFLQLNLANAEREVVIPTAVVVVLMVVTLVSMYAQPTSNANLSFKVPLVPFIPALSICINLYLMMMLDGNTWIRFGVWMVVGLPIYFISSCILYKKSDQKPSKNVSKPVNNGHINHTYIHENGNSKNNATLTIPAIVVDVPKVELEKIEEELQNSETNTTEIRQRTFSINSNDMQNAVLEIDKVLNDTYYDISLENFEAINPENEYKNSTILIKQLDENKIIDETKEQSSQYERISTCSSNSASDHSREHHVEAQIHQEDSDELNEEQTCSEDLNSEVLTSEVQIEELIIEKDINNDEESNLNNEENETVEETVTEEISTIPVPPPIEGLFMELPKTPNRIVFDIDFSAIKLKPVTEPIPRIRTDSIKSDGPADNVKQGSIQYNKIKLKLDGIFKVPRQLKTSDRKFVVEDISSSPTVEKETESIEMIDRVLEQFEEIPDDFGKTKEFKDTLSGLLLRKHSLNITQPEQKRKYEKNNESETITTKNDEVNHKKRMADSLRSIKSLSDIKKISEEEIDDEIDKDSTPEKDSEKHRKLMVATFRSIKLKRTGLPLTDEDRRESREELTGEDTREIREEITDTPEKDSEKHKKLMVGTFRSIKLKRTGLPLTDEDRRKSREELTGEDTRESEKI